MIHPLRKFIPSLPVAVARLISINVLVAIAIWCAFGLRQWFGVSDSTFLDIFLLPAQLSEFIYRPWSILTYMFAQANFFQLLFNMLWLYWFGIWLADTDSQATLVGQYIGGGLTGAIFYILSGTLFPGSGSVMMGSSASILAVMVYTAIRQPGRHVPLFLIGKVRLKWIAIFSIVLTLLGGTGSAAHLAHIGGAAFPFIYIGFKNLKFRKPTSKVRRKCPEILRKTPIRNPQSRPPDSGIQDPEAILDALLDKIRVSGYDSLSESEKKLLDKVSSKLKKET